MEQSDVFVSYRRSDVEFTKQLVKALQSTGREVWVDWEDIPPGVEGFSDEIQRGIEATDAFIAILSPSYLQSPYCLMELREALRLKKRVVPIVVHKFDPEPPPEGIGHINWVYFTPHAGQDNTFEESFPRVIEALEADHEHARTHTRLLTRAIEWEKREHERSYLLKGAEIDQAEGWQVEASTKSPAPTELQLNYILDSRKQQRIQQRRLTISISVLLVLAVITGIFAVYQTYRARESAEIAHSNALASAALQPDNQDIAVALALEATRSENPSPHAYKALAQVAYPADGVRYFMKSSESVYEFLSPAISPDGRYVVIKNKMYDLATGDVVQEFKNAPRLTLTGLFLPDGKRVILAGDRDAQEHSADLIYLGLYDVATGELLRKYDTEIGISEVQLSADGKTLVAYQPDEKVSWWDIDSGKKIWGFVDNVGDAGYSLYTFSPDLKWMAKSVEIWAGNEAGESEATTTLYIIDTRTMKVEQTITDFENVAIDFMTFSNNSKELAVKAWDSDTYENYIHVIDVETGQVNPKSIHMTSWVEGLRFSPDDKSLAVRSEDQSVLVLDREGNIVQKQTAHGSPLLLAEFTQQGDRIVSMDSSGVIMTWDLLPGNLEQHLFVDEILDGITPDGRYLILEGPASMDRFDHLIVRDATTLEEILSLPLQGIPSDPHDGSTIYSWLDSYYLEKGMEKGLFSYIITMYSPEYELVSSTVHIASLANGEIIRTFNMPKGTGARNAKISPDGDLAYLSYTDADGLEHLDSWNIATGELTNTFIPPDPGYLHFTLNPAGTRLLVSSISSDDENGVITGSSVRLLDVSNQEVLFKLDGKQQMNAFFTPDGSQFVIVKGSEFGELKSDFIVYDLETGKVVNQYILDVYPLTEIKVMPDGKSFIESTSTSGFGGGYNFTPSGVSLRTREIMVYSTFRQWDWFTGELMWEFPSYTYYAFFSPDGKRMYSLVDESLAVWRFDSHDELIAWACANRYVPEFTEQQRERFNIENDVSLCREFED